MRVPSKVRLGQLDEQPALVFAVRHSGIGEFDKLVAVGWCEWCHNRFCFDYNVTIFAPILFPKMKLIAEHLVKRYGSRTVVKDVSFQAEKGEIVGLLGPNGAGKTTSFYMIVGLITPNGGNIYLDDLNVTKEPIYKRAKLGIGYLAQEASVFRKLSVEDNIMSILEMTDLAKDQQKEKLESLLTEFSLHHIRKSLGIQLSGGERRRTEIARALAIDPSFILLDEPFAGVDPIAVEDIQRIVRQLKERGIGVIITDHNVQETLCITDRTYLLYDGRIMKEGSARELADDEEVRRVYLGQNFVLRE